MHQFTLPTLVNTFVSSKRCAICLFKIYNFIIIFSLYIHNIIQYKFVSVDFNLFSLIRLFGLLPFALLRDNNNDPGNTDCDSFGTHE